MRMKLMLIVLIVGLSTILFTGCGSGDVKLQADQSMLRDHISTLTVPDHVQVVGLGEASHGTKEYQQMKIEVFKALVENNESRTFIIEGDFGGALKVNSYIHGADGTAVEAVKGIGFRVYQTQEMVDIVEWMRSYNQTALPGESLNFYGMDIQRFDHNKEQLFSVLDVAAPELSEKYKAAFIELTDEKRLTLNTDVLAKSKEAASQLMKEMDTNEKVIVTNMGQIAFDFAKESGNTIYAYIDLLLSSPSDYNTIRDQYMFEKVNWFLKHSDNKLLFINGHNGHIGKTSVAGYTSLGVHLHNSMGDHYFAIGTDAKYTQFQSQSSKGSFSVKEVTNENDLNHQLDAFESEFYYVDILEAKNNDNWNTILDSKQAVTTLNVGISAWQKLFKSFYTTSIIPSETYDGMIVFKRVTPSTLLK